MATETTEVAAGRELALTTDRLTYVGHATTLLDLEGTTILTDPVVGRWIGPLRRQGPAAKPASLHGPDLVLVSHLHRDHFDLPSLRQVAPHTPMIVPRGAGELAARSGATEVREVSVGEEIWVRGVTITAVPARHDPRRSRLGPRAEPLGYILATERRRVYFAGDTGLFPEMSSLGPLELALLPVWDWGPSVGPGHMDPADAAWALPQLRPELAVPIHWGTFYPLGLNRLRPGPLREPPLEFARLAEQAAPEVEVRVLQPGSSLALDAEEEG